MVHGLSDNSARPVYLGYMYYMASLLPMLLTIITPWSSMEVVWGLVKYVNEQNGRYKNNCHDRAKMTFLLSGSISFKN